MGRRLRDRRLRMLGMLGLVLAACAKDEPENPFDGQATTVLDGTSESTGAGSSPGDTTLGTGTATGADTQSGQDETTDTGIKLDVNAPDSDVGGGKGQGCAYIDLLFVV